MVAEIDRLDPAWLDPLRVAAAIPHPELDDLRALCGVGPATAAIDGAERMGLLSVRGRALRFRHPLLETALLDGLSTLERRVLHRRCAAHATDPEVRAGHLAAAAEALDARVDDRGVHRAHRLARDQSCFRQRRGQKIERRITPCGNHHGQPV